MYCLPGYKKLLVMRSVTFLSFLKKKFLGHLCSLFNGLLAHKCLALLTSNKHDNSVLFWWVNPVSVLQKVSLGKQKSTKVARFWGKSKVRIPPDLDCEFLRVARTRQDAPNFLPLVNFGSLLLRIFNHPSTYFSKFKHKHHAHDIRTMVGCRISVENRYPQKYAEQLLH